MTYENQLQLIFSRMLLALGQMVCNISCFDEIEAALTIIKCYFYYIIYTPVMILWIQCILCEKQYCFISQTIKFLLHELGSQFSLDYGLKQNKKRKANSDNIRAIESIVARESYMVCEYALHHSGIRNYSGKGKFYDT